MPFWLHESRLSIWYKGIRLWYKIVITMGIFTLLAFSYFLIFYFPLYVQINQIQKELLVLDGQEKAFREVLIRYNDVIDAHNNLESKFKQCVQTSFSAQRIIGTLLQLMQKNGISCRGIHEQQRVIKDFYEKQYISLIGKGSFEKMLSFFNDVGRSNCPIKFKALHLYKGKQGNHRFKAIIRIVIVGG